MDSQLDQIGHIDFQGSDRQTFTNIGQITQPFSLTVYAGGFLGILLMITYAHNSNCKLYYSGLSSTLTK